VVQQLVIRLNAEYDRSGLLPLTVEVSHNAFAFTEYLLEPGDVKPGSGAPACGLLNEVVVICRRYRYPQVGKGARYVIVFNPKMAK
jgi:hypothetical protein